jgi:CheY-like chemotaxis protein
MKMVRLSSGVPGLDDILTGGFPAGQMYLIAGNPGAGKTTLGLHFLRDGVARGERCVYVVLSESETALRRLALSHGWETDGIDVIESIDQDPAFRRTAAQVLTAAGFQVLEASSGRAGMAELGHWMPDGVILDLDVDDVDAVQLVRAVMSDAAPRPSIVGVTERVDVARIVEIMRLGARDVLTKPVDGARLKESLMRAIEHGELARDVGKLERVLTDADNGYALVADHRWLLVKLGATLLLAALLRK